MKQELRLSRIIKALTASQSTSIGELAEALHVSTMTIRRDLKLLESTGAIKTLRSGLVLGENPIKDDPTLSSGYQLAAARYHRAEEKLRIAKKAATFIEDRDVVLLDAGSTVEFMLEFIPKHLNLTVICFTLNIMSIISTRTNITGILAGGIFHASSMMFESPEGMELIRQSRVKKAFISANGVQEKLGVTCSHVFEREIKKAAINSSLFKVLLVDSSKFGEMQKNYFADITDFDSIITDSNIPFEYKTIIKNKGISLEIV